MRVNHYIHFRPMVMIDPVVDDFGAELSLLHDLGYPTQSDAFTAAFLFLADGGALPGASEGELH